MRRIWLPAFVRQATAGNGVPGLPDQLEMKTFKKSGARERGY